MTARRVRGLAAAAFALATIAHLVFWYAPRERAASPGRLAAELEAPDVEFGIWLAHPHQNLAALARRVDDPRRWAARLSGREVDVVPAFGPFLVPPASELAVVAGPEGSLRAAARLHPTFALLARAAGRLAGNPWLAGGAVGRGQVRWEGRVWRYRSDPAPVDGPALPTVRAVAQSQEAVLALVRTARPFGPLPAGRFRIGRFAAGSGSGSIELRGGDPPEGWPAAIAPGSPAPAAWWVERLPPDGVRGGLIDIGGSTAAGLPLVAVFDRGAGGFDLPGESLVALVGGEIPERVVDGLRVRALDRTALEVAVPFGRAVTARLTAEFERLAAVDPGRVGPAAGDLARAARKLPLVGSREARPLEQLAALLEPLAGCPLAALAVGRGEAWTRLVPCADPAPAARVD